MEGKIETIAFGGDGILRHEGMVVFVPFTAPQDKVKIELTKKKKTHAFGKILEIKEPSGLRTVPLCPQFGSCGGCQLQHLNYEAQLEVKRRFVEEALTRIAKVTIQVPPVVPAPTQWAYRRHIRLNMRKKGQSYEAGYINCDGVSLLSPQHCPLFEKEGDAVLAQLHTFLKTLDSRESEEASLRLFKTSQERYLFAFSFSEAFPKNRKALIEKALKEWPQWQGVLMQSPSGREEFGDVTSTIEVEGLKIQYSPYGFIQNHPEQSLNLYRALLEQISPSSQRVLDLYCGVGISSLLLGKRGRKVVGVENHWESIELAKLNAKTNIAPSVTFVEGAAERLSGELFKTFKPGTLLVNPPRTGLENSLIKEILQALPKEILYTSCMPSTLARDLKLLTESSYKITWIQAFDMFPQTTHVETIVKLALNEESYI